jgi:hypothetical protein
MRLSYRQPTSAVHGSLYLPKPIHLDQVAQFFVDYQTAASQLRIEYQVIHREANLCMRP